MTLKSYSELKRKKSKRKKGIIGSYIDILLGTALISETSKIINKL